MNEETRAAAQAEAQTTSVGLCAALEKNGWLLCRAEGSSMRPFLKGGRDWLLLRKITTPPRRWQVVLYRRPESGRYVLHRVVGFSGNDLVCQGDGCAWRERVGRETVLAVLTEIRRGERVLDPYSPRRMRAVRLWYRTRRARGILRHPVKKLRGRMRK